MSLLQIKRKNIKELEKSKDIIQADIETVVLTRIGLEIYPENLLFCKNIKFVLASTNKLTVLPSFNKYRNMTVCDLSNNRLTAFPAGVLSCMNLRVLDLSGNRLHCISTRIIELTNLIALRASDNFLDEFPTELCSMINLQVLSLRNNSIRVIPASIEKLKCLKKLYLQQNRIMTLPISIINTSIGDFNGTLRLSKNLLIPTLKLIYETSGHQGILDLFERSNPVELFNSFEVELKKQFYLTNIGLRN